MNRRLLIVVTLLAAIFLGYQPAWSQATIGSGGIQGTVTDPQGAAVPNAEVTIASSGAGKTLDVVTNASGLYSSGALSPGIYTVRVSAQGFNTFTLSVTVQVGSVSTGNIALTLGAASTVVEVTGGQVLVNTEQAEVQGVVTQDQIENLPINGRNFLDLAQLEPGVQIQDGGDFDPTKTGFSSISFGGRYGRTARIEVDGVDVSDETVGTTTESIPASAISEFQVAQSSLDLSNELTSSGAVNVVTRSGTNAFHGEGYGLFRDSSEGAELPGGGTYQRNQEGGDFGGAVIKDKLFFFADGERTLQHAGAGVAPSAPFQSFAGNFPSPFKEGDLLGRVDFQATKSLHLFFRYGYFTNYLIPAFGSPSFSFFANENITRNEVVGGDWTNGPWTHSVRFEYLKFQNKITDAVRGSGEPFSEFPVSFDSLVSNLSTGPSPNAPQETPQSDHQFKYDGSRIWGSHIFRYGFAYNHIHGGGFASFFAFAPLALNFGGTDPNSDLTCPGGQTGTACPLNYTADELIIGNGEGYGSEKPAFGQPFGGNGPDNRIAFYVGDSWKIKQNVTLTYGVRYVRDTGRTDSDLPAIPALNAVMPGFGDRVHQPNANFGPQIGLAWDPFKTGKTVIRGGVGIYYENAIFNNVLFDRGPRLQTGTFFFADSAPCLGGAAGPVQFGDGSVQTIPGGNTLCSSGLGQPIPNSAVGATCPAGIIVAQCMANFQTAYATSYQTNPLGPNPGYIGNEVANGLPISSIYAPNYLTPRSVQMNVGIQRELSKGTVLTVDYVRNIGTHFLLGIDENHTGDAAYLNVPAAQAAVATTLGFCGVGTINQSITLCPTDPLGPTDAANLAAAGTPYVPRPATISDYAQNGLDSPKDLNVGACPSPIGGIGKPCAFGGANPNVGPTSFLEPTARTLYNALDVKLTQNVHNPVPGIKYLNMQVAYAFSRFKYCGSSNGLASPGTPENQDADFIDASLDNRSACQFFGPTLLDRTHQLNFGGYAQLPKGFQLGIVGHIWSPLAITPLLNDPGSSGAPGAIFVSDFTGDGTVDDPLPLGQTDSSCGSFGGNCNYQLAGTGAFGRSLSPAGLTKAVNNYNGTIANQMVTPAGQALINASIFTQTQLQGLGATPSTITYTDPATGNQIPGVIPGEVGPDWLKTMDFQISWVGHIGERLTITPSVGFFNVFNLRNWDSSGNTLSGALSGAGGSINGTFGNFLAHPNSDQTRTNAIGTGTGVFALGAPRAIEWGLKFQF
jgi:Carboxypeptidase regulatory-like domain